MLESSIEVVLADSHKLMRRSLRLLLEQAAGIVVVAEAASLALTRQHVAGHRPDVLVLDLRMPDGSSLEELVTLLAGTPGLRILATSVEESPRLAQRVLADGASGYVLKEHADVELPLAVRTAAQGGTYLSPVLVRPAAGGGSATAR